MSKSTQKQLLFIAIEAVKTQNNVNTYFDYMIKDEHHASKIKAEVLSQAQIIQAEHEEPKNVKVVKEIKDIKANWSLTSFTFKDIEEEAKKLRNTTFIDDVVIENDGTITFIVSKELRLRNEESSRNSGRKNICFDLKNIKESKSTKDMFFQLYANAFRHTKVKYIPVSFLINLFGMKAETKEQFKSSKRTINRFLESREMLIKYKKKAFYIKHPESNTTWEDIQEQVTGKPVNTAKKVEKINFNKDTDFKEEVNKDVVFDDINDLTVMDDFELETAIKEIPTSETIKTDIDSIDLEDAFDADGMPFNKTFDYREMHRNAMKIKSACFKKKKY